MGQEVSKTFRGRCRLRLSKKEVRTWSRKKAFSGQRGAWRRMNPRMSLGGPNRGGSEKPGDAHPAPFSVPPPCAAPGAHRRMVCAAHFLLAAFLRPRVPRHHDWMQMAVETTDG